MFSLIHIIDVAILLSFLIAFRSTQRYRRRRGLRYPPGPPGWPIIGNLLDISPSSPWLPYTEFSKKYGHIVSCRVFGQDIILLNTITAIKDIFEKRGNIYSDRPVFQIVDLLEWNWQLPMARYGETWRHGRKLLDRVLRPGAAATYRPMQQARARVLLSRLLLNPNEWKAHVELFQGELTLGMTYGYEVKGRHDRVLDVSIRLNKFADFKFHVFAMFLNSFPFLRHIPAWVPYISFKPFAQIGRKLGEEVVQEPMRFVKESIASGTARPSLALEYLQEIDKLSPSDPSRGEAEKTLANALGSLYSEEGSDEIDAVVGRERLPTFDDRSRLPFVDAMCREVLRWRPSQFLTQLRKMFSEDFFIPKGEAIFQDPSIYPEPDVFKPERFLNSDGSLRDDPLLLSAFGYGKRICPGRHFVDATLFIYVASLLSVFRIEEVQDGQEKRSKYKYTGSLINHPEPFSCSIIPRDKVAEELITADAMAR
ncbi:cytochrome P450 [Lactarius quietus]|nr:cytochrome P450 [Lactarius quietus]